LVCQRDVGRALRAVRVEVARRPRDADRLNTDVLSMRPRIWRQERGAVDGSFDVKHSSGGIIDVEFIAQHLILRHAAAHPGLCDVGDLAGALERGAALRLLPEHGARAADAAYRQYRSWMHRERLRGTRPSAWPPIWPSRIDAP
jgi:glutamate-ammonia-ligase adenylyltransferase